MKVWFLAGAAALVLAGCGGSDDSGGNQGGSGGSGAGSAGTSSTGGSAGTSSTGGNAGTSSTGGSAGTSSTGGSANAKPTGPVYSCFGKCPLEECDNGMFWADVACSDVYPGPVEMSAFCAMGASGGYCLEIGMDEFGFDNQKYAVNCTSGVSSIAACESGCGISGTQPAQCL